MKIIILLFISLFSLQIHSQNLVPNPSFEELLYPEYHHLVKEPGWVKGGQDLIKYWYKPTRSGPAFVSTADNEGAHTGNISARFSMFNNISKEDLGANKRDYLAVKLFEPLINGEKYVVSFYVKEWYNYYAVNSIGYLLSIDSIKVNTDGVLDLVPDFQVEEIIHSPERNWILIQDTFVANGDEEFLVLGNFSPNEITKYQKVKLGSSKIADYYIDDVSVFPLNEGLHFLYVNQRQDSKIIIPGSFFETDQIINEKGKIILDSLAGFLLSVPEVKLEIIGHADSTENDDADLEISRKKAYAVRDYLISSGVGAERMDAAGIGSAEPLNYEKKGMKSNRVEINFFK